MTQYRVRPYAPRDLDAVYEICLRTGDSGEDASHLYDDPKALGHVYAGPYVTLEPDLAFVLEDESTVCGYILGALDTREFDEAYVREWLPHLQDRIPRPQGEPEGWSRTERIYHQLHNPHRELRPEFERYPSHLHIDLLPRAQAKGNGRRLMETLLEALRSKGSPGVHLGVGVRNERAQAFYRAMGFDELRRNSNAVYMVKELRP